VFVGCFHKQVTDSVLCAERKNLSEACWIF